MGCDWHSDRCDLGASDATYHLLSHATGTVEVVTV